MCHEAEIDYRVKGTEYAAMIDRHAHAQRSGVLASLNMVAESLKLLPKEADTTNRWSAATWANERKGWLFLTSTPATRERLVPLTSLWLDTLVLRLMNYGRQALIPCGSSWMNWRAYKDSHNCTQRSRKTANRIILLYLASKDGAS